MGPRGNFKEESQTSAGWGCCQVANFLCRFGEIRGDLEVGKGKK